MLDDPATIGDALREAETIPFRGRDRYTFNDKRQRFIAGMGNHEKLEWIDQMKIFLYGYKK